MPIFFSRKKQSLLLDFTAIAVATILVFILLLTWFVTKNIHDQSSEITEKLDIKGEKISRAFNDIMDFTAHEMTHIGRQISKNPNNVNYINFILEAFQTRPDDVVSWSTFMWTDKNHNIIVTNNFGMIRPGKNLAGRDYIPKTAENPWKFFTGQPVFGATSGKWSIPAGLGITDEKSRYVGSLVTGIVISKLIAKLESVTQTEDISFAILDDKFQIIVQSSNNEAIINNNGIINEISKIQQNPDRGLLVSKSNILNGYAYYHKMPDYPYIILTSYNKANSDKYIINNILFGVAEIALIIITFLSTLFFLYKRIVNPIVTLSSYADDLSKGQYRDNIPSSNTYEIHNLAMQIANIQNYLQKIERISLERNTAKEAADFANILNQAKTEFLAATAHELRSPLNVIIGMSEVIKTKMFGESVDNYIEYASDIEQSGYELLEFIADLIDKSKAENGNFALDHEDYIDIQNIIHRSIKLNISRANKSNTTINIHVEENLPELFADGRRMQQVLVNLISNSIKYSPADTIINISAIQRDKKIVIIIADQGFGMNNEQVSIALSKWGTVKNENSGKVDSAGLGLPLAKHLVELHGAEFLIASEPGKGTIITMIFPEDRVKF